MNASPMPQEHRRAVFLLSLSAFASASSVRLCDPMLPALMHQFHTSAESTIAVVSDFSIAYGVMQLFFGPLSEKVGKYRLIAWATLACLVGSLGAFLAQTLDQLILARLLSGATAAGIIPLSMAWIGDTTHYEQRQATLARFLGGQIMGVIGGQFIGGAVTDLVGYHWAFGFMACLYWVVGIRVLHEARHNPVVIGSRRPVSSHPSLLHQWVAVLHLPWARHILLTVAIEGALVFGPLALIPTFLHQKEGLSLTHASMIMATFGLGGFSYTLLARHFVAGLGETGLARLGGISLGIAWFILALAPPWGWALPAGSLIGFGYYLLHNTLQTHATQMAPELRGTAVSLFASLFFLGQALGVMAAARIYTTWSPSTLFAVPMLLLPLLGHGFALSIERKNGASLPR